MGEEQRRPGNKFGRDIDVTPAEAYYFCGIPPDRFDRYTPQEIGFMVKLARTKRDDEEWMENVRVARLTAHLFALFGAPIEWRNPKKFMPVKPGESLEEKPPEQRGMGPEEFMAFVLGHNKRIAARKKRQVKK